MTFGIFGVASAYQVFALQQTTSQLEELQRTISTGKRVNSVLDGVDSFVTSVELQQRSVELTSRLDDISSNLTKVNTARSALNKLTSSFSSERSELVKERNQFQEDRVDLGAQILEDNPVLYYRFDDEAGNPALNEGSLGAATNGTYRSASSGQQKDLYYGINNSSAFFDGSANSGITVPNNAQINSSGNIVNRSVELVFEATDLGGRQVLFEKGGTSNSMAIYLDDGKLYADLRDQGSFGPFGISTNIEEGETYHVAMTFDSDASEFNVYVNGKLIGSREVTNPFPAHSGAIGIGFKNGGLVYHDGPSGGTGDRFKGYISDLAIHNTTLSAARIKERFDSTLIERAQKLEDSFLATVEAIDNLIKEGRSGATNLLAGGSLDTGPDSVTLSRIDIDAEDFGFRNKYDFRSLSNISRAINELDNAIADNEADLARLDLGRDSLNIRDQFVNDLIAELEASSEKLVVADVDEAQARKAALETRQAFQFSVFGATQGNNILQQFASLGAPGGGSILTSAATFR